MSDPISLSGRSETSTVMKKRTVIKYVAATLSIAVAIGGPASALDVGVGGQVGGVEVGAGAGVGSGGASLGAGASADGVGGANLGSSVDTGNGAPSASVGAGGNVDGVGGANSGVSVGTGSGAPSASDGGTSGAAGGTTGGSTAGSAGGSTGGSSTGSATNSAGASVGSQGTEIRRDAARGTHATLPHGHPAAQPRAFRSRHIGAGYLGLSAIAQTHTQARHVKCGGAGLPAGDLLGGQAAGCRGSTGGQRRACAAATQRPYSPAVGAHQLRERGPSGKGWLPSRRGRHSHRCQIAIARTIGQHHRLGAE